MWHAAGTDPFRRLPERVRGHGLRLLMPHEVDTAFDALQKTKGLISHMRGYPNGTSRAIVARLCDKS